MLKKDDAIALGNIEHGKTGKPEIKTVYSVSST